MLLLAAVNLQTISTLQTFVKYFRAPQIRNISLQMQRFRTYYHNTAVSLFKEGVEERCVDSGVKVDSHFLPLVKIAFSTITSCLWGSKKKLGLLQNVNR